MSRLKVRIVLRKREVAMTADLFEVAERRMQKAVETLKQDINAIRAGRANAALVERITIDYYGTPTPINQVASISVPEARLLVIQPWDRKLLTDIEKAIQRSDLGINPTNDGQVIRLVLPQLTQDRRKELVKQVHQRAEEARVAVRNCRRDALDHLRKAEKDGGISQEDEKRAQERLQKLTDGFIKRVEEVSRHKETEVMEV